MNLINVYEYVCTPDARSCNSLADRKSAVALTLNLTISTYFIFFPHYSGRNNNARRKYWEKYSSPCIRESIYSRDVHNTLSWLTHLLRGGKKDIIVTENGNIFKGIWCIKDIAMRQWKSLKRRKEVTYESNSGPLPLLQSFILEDSRWLLLSSPPWSWW